MVVQVYWFEFLWLLCFFLDYLSNSLSIIEKIIQFTGLLARMSFLFCFLKNVHR
ncbi:hypothetical protein F4703DRAFT_1867480 [Phycomyces blakesleeanus]